ncbi:Hormone receptor domain [Nesidiocoris tenuis]|uniref:Hormone receptor domain n=1 Tax=Nesidiocoris tenuis TaxID=355587 RepID=A0ABN7AQK8_9HEMI|nr:Hormone receptor domain [Nesidiocoris tenuis]
MTRRFHDFLHGKQERRNWDVPTNPNQLEEFLQVKELECNKKNQSSPAGHCAQVWDTILCWPDTPAGMTAKQPCPSYFSGFNESAYATKQCLENGTWFVNKNDTLWTNYTSCLPNTISSDVPNKYVTVIKLISAMGYGVSLATLAVAFIILASFKRLRCPRNVLHMHLFVSFILRAGLRLVKDGVFVQGIMPSSDLGVVNLDILSASPTGTWGCKLLICLWQYAIISNYSWILMEGLYLHNLIFLALFTDNSAITIYIILGWGLPLGSVVPWAVLRALYDDELCWTTHKNPRIRLYLDLPIIVSTVSNFFLFINIVRVLLLKLTASISEENRRFRRWAKSTLVLVPLFGAHYAIFYSMKLMNDETMDIIWLFIDQLFGSFQGTFVAILYCFMNAEVQGEINKLWIGSELCGWRSSTRRFLGFSRDRISSRKSRPSTAGESCMTSFISTTAQSEGSNYRRKTAPIITPVSEVSKLEKQLEDP